MPEDKLSFIPKKNNAQNPLYKSKGPGAFFAASFFAVLASVFLYGGVFLYKNNLNKQINMLNDSLLKIQSALQPEVIAELVKASQKITLSKSLLNSHWTLIPIFELLEKNTLKTVQFTDFKYNVDENGEPKIFLKGVAGGYVSLVLQAQAFKEDKNIKNAEFSGWALMDKDKGKVSFSVDMILNPSFLNYKE